MMTQFVASFAAGPAIWSVLDRMSVAKELEVVFLGEIFELDGVQ
jgi:hypothetical protein